MGERSRITPIIRESMNKIQQQAYQDCDKSDIMFDEVNQKIEER